VIFKSFLQIEKAHAKKKDKQIRPKRKTKKKEIQKKRLFKLMQIFGSR